MRIYVLLVGLCFAIVHNSSGQVNKDIIILMVENNRVELERTLRFLDSKNPRLICINLDLECSEDDSDRQLLEEFTNINSLVLPSVVRPFGTGEYRDIIPCSLIYPKGVTTGFINLVSSERDNLVDKVQIKNSFGKRVSYHLAVNIARSIDKEKTEEFIKSHLDTITIDLGRERKFLTAHIEDFDQKRISGDVITGKIVIVSTFPYDYYLVGEDKKTLRPRNMSTSEIFANIACQIVGL